MSKQTYKTILERYQEELRLELEEEGTLSQTKLAYKIIKEASGFGQTEVVQYLIREFKVNINFIYQDGTTPLIHACRENRIDTAKFLLERGADINAQTINGWPPLINVCAIGNINMIRFLLENKADVNIQTESAMTALMFACRIGNFDIATLLIKEGNANIYLRDKDDLSALDFAIESHNSNKNDIIELFIKKDSNLFYKSKAMALFDHIKTSIVKRITCQKISPINTTESLKPVESEVISKFIKNKAQIHPEPYEEPGDSDLSECTVTFPAYNNYAEGDKDHDTNLTGDAAF
jgi:ankyrin repeat protein